MLRSTTQASSRQDFSGFFQGPERLSTTHRSQTGSLSIHEDSNYFMVSLEFSSFDKTSLDLWVQDHQLTLTAARRSQGASKGAEPSAFFSCIDLPSTVDEDSIQAELKDAQLDVRFRKESRLLN
ncbi:Hsp20/alpha crystallin family protein [Oligoflexus tunisiensis]|uniref:Hsp20/alpha crystallin family protein n=1 Tax=Oligoflexus tunisiensis TaxID=708132 RepID=UPI00159F31CB|nr:Hsp20/alpha crystallin family protein [Oligoflexus tunisiensis]